MPLRNFHLNHFSTMFLASLLSTRLYLLSYFHGRNNSFVSHRVAVTRNDEVLLANGGCQVHFVVRVHILPGFRVTRSYTLYIRHSFRYSLFYVINERYSLQGPCFSVHMTPRNGIIFPSKDTRTLPSFLLKVH